MSRSLLNMASRLNAVRVDVEVTFDQSSFLDRVLSLAEPEGAA